jgi:Zn-dependent protease with chaperone function
MRGGSLWRVGAAAVTALIVAEAAVWLLRPREPGIAPAKVSASDYFPASEIERATSFQDGQRALLLASLAVEGVVLIALSTGHPRVARRALVRLGKRPVLGAAAAGAAISLTLSLANLPVGAIGQGRAVDYGLSTQSLGGWLQDQAKSMLIGALLTAAVASLLIALVRRFGRSWWIPGTGALIVLAVLFTWIAPVVLAPVFNRFRPLPAGRDRAAVLELGSKAGVDIGQVYSVDASRRSTALNAYVDGVGPSKRVVIYDNLLNEVRRPLLRSVVAHELGHVRHNDIWRGLAWFTIVAPFSLLFVREATDALARRTGTDPATPASLPTYALVLAVATFALGVIGNQLSREVEASADSFALRLTHDPKALIDVQRRLSKANLAEPDPPAVATALLGTHPSTMDRIGAAVAWKRGER